jgi:kynurenine/2-aminoadipate aminotransferase
MPLISNYARFLNRVALAREPSPIRSLQALVSLPGMISLGGGLPNPAMFPFTNIDVTLDTGEKISLRGTELSNALQYTVTAAYPKFGEWVSSYVKRFHRPPYDDWTYLVSTGSQDALTKTFEAILSENDVILVENPSYPGALSALRPLGCRIVGVNIDAGGLVPEELATTLAALKREGASVKALYTSPTGQNPSGATLSLDRKRRIYEICSNYDVLILEDDAYYFLQLEELESKDPHFPYRDDPEICAPVASFMSLDVDGRVVRFDSLSKVLSSGLRLGWMSGPKPIVERINMHMQANELHASSLSQAIVAAMLEQWGDAGFRRHIGRIQAFYRQRRDTLYHLIEKHLTGLVDYSKPAAGMFAWMRLRGIEDSNALIVSEAREKKVLLVPGQAFSPDNKTKSNAVRATYSLASESEMDEALRRFAEILNSKKH